MSDVTDRLFSGFDSTSYQIKIIEKLRISNLRTHDQKKNEPYRNAVGLSEVSPKHLGFSFNFEGKVELWEMKEAFLSFISTGDKHILNSYTKEDLEKANLNWIENNTVYVSLPYKYQNNSKSSGDMKCITYMHCVVDGEHYWLKFFLNKNHVFEYDRVTYYEYWLELKALELEKIFTEYNAALHKDPVIKERLDSIEEGIIKDNKENKDMKELLRSYISYFSAKCPRY